MDHMTHNDHGQVPDPHSGHKMSNDHGSHDRHAGHSVAMFRDKFWLSFALTIRRILVNRRSTLAWLHRALLSWLEVCPRHPRNSGLRLRRPSLRPRGMG